MAFVDSKAYSTETNLSRHFFFQPKLSILELLHTFSLSKSKLQTLDIGSRYKTGAVTPQTVINDKAY